MFGDGACNQGTFGETMNLAALWRLPIVFLVTNNQFGMGTALERHSAVTELRARGEGYGVPGLRCDGMDVLDTHRVVSEARCVAHASERQPTLVEAVTYRYRGHSMADPERYRTREQVERVAQRATRSRCSGRASSRAGCSTSSATRGSTREATARVDEAVEFAGCLALPRAGDALRRRLRARRPGPRVVLGAGPLSPARRGRRSDPRSRARARSRSR